MQTNYKAFIGRLISKYEGGYNWNKHDRGGPTNFGITCYDLAEHRKEPMDSMAKWAPLVKEMPLTEAEDIYQSKYGKGILFDFLPAGIDCAMLDYAVNSGNGRAVRVACAILGLPASTHITQAVLDGLKKVSPRHFINALCDERLHFMKGIAGGADWKSFGHGWQARVDDVRAYSLALVDKQTPPEPPVIPPHPKAEHEAPDAGAHVQQASLVSVGGGMASHASGQAHTITLLVIAAFLLAGVVVYFYRKNKADRLNATVVLPPAQENTHVEQAEVPVG